MINRIRFEVNGTKEDNSQHESTENHMNDNINFDTMCTTQYNCTYLNLRLTRSFRFKLRFSQTGTTTTQTRNGRIFSTKNDEKHRKTITATQRLWRGAQKP